MLQSRFKNWVNQEVEKKLDEERFSTLPLRMRIGIFLLIGAFVFGYGIPILLIVISHINHQITFGLTSGSLVYAVSWIIGALGLVLAGKDCIKYPKYFFAKLIKKLFPGLF